MSKGLISTSKGFALNVTYECQIYDWVASDKINKSAINKLRRLFVFVFTLKEFRFERHNAVVVIVVVRASSKQFRLKNYNFVK